jgi:hypothetical protein
MERNSDLESVTEDEDGCEEWLFTNTIILCAPLPVTAVIARLFLRSLPDFKKHMSPHLAATLPNMLSGLRPGSHKRSAAATLPVYLHTSDTINTSSYQQFWLESARRTLGNVYLAGDGKVNVKRDIRKIRSFCPSIYLHPITMSISTLRELTQKMDFG